MRKIIVDYLVDKPMNANQISKALNVNYRTVMHHIKILEGCRLIEGEGPKYGKIYFPSQLLRNNIEAYRRVTQVLNSVEEK